MSKEIKKENKIINEANVSTITESLSSVKLIKCAGNEIRPEIKVYDDNPDKAYEKAIELMDRALKKYPNKEK